MELACNFSVHFFSLQIEMWSKVYLGSQLVPKVPTKLYQEMRSTCVGRSSSGQSFFRFNVFQTFWIAASKMSPVPDSQVSLSHPLDKRADNRQINTIPWRHIKKHLSNHFKQNATHKIHLNEVCNIKKLRLWPVCAFLRWSFQFSQQVLTIVYGRNLGLAACVPVATGRTWMSIRSMRQGNMQNTRICITCWSLWDAIIMATI